MTLAGFILLCLCCSVCAKALCRAFFAQFKISSLERKSQKKEGCTALSKSTEEQSLKKVKSARIYKCTRALANTALLDVPFVKPFVQPKCLIRLDLVIGLVNSHSRIINARKKFLACHGITFNFSSKRCEILVMPNSRNFSYFIWNSAKNFKIFTQNHEKYGKLSFMDFMVSTNGVTWNQVHTRFT